MQATKFVAGLCIALSSITATSMSHGAELIDQVEAVAAVEVFDGAGGIWILNLGTGGMSYCAHLWSSNSSGPSSTGKCAPIGFVGTSTTGYSVKVVENGIFSFRKQTGQVFHCVQVYNATRGNVLGSCKLLSNITLLN